MELVLLPEPTVVPPPAAESSGETWANLTDEVSLDPTPLPPYWNLPARVLFATLIGALMVASVVGNLLVILVIARNRGMRTRTNIFLCNLAVADLSCALFDMPISLVTMAKGEWVFNETVCQLNGFLTPLFLVASVHTLMYISVHKYLSIKNPFVHGFRRKWIFAMLLASWTWAALSGYFTVSGLNSASYHPYSAQCGPDRPHDAKSYVHFGLNFATCIVVPLTIMTLSYIGVFTEMKAHSVRMQKNTTIEKDRILDQQKRITVTIFLVLVIFVVCWLPFNMYTIYLSIAGENTQIPPYADPFSYLFCYINVAANPIVYALRSAAFREGYKQILCRRKAKYWEDEPDDPMSRRFARLKSFMRESLHAQMADSTISTGSLSSRKNSVISLSPYIFGGRRRTDSTASLPHHLTYGMCGKQQRRSKVSGAGKRHVLQVLARLFSRDGDDRRRMIPEVVVSGPADSSRTVVPSPEPCELDAWELVDGITVDPLVQTTAAASRVTGYSAALTNDVNILVGGQGHTEVIPTVELLGLEEEEEGEVEGTEMVTAAIVDNGLRVSEVPSFWQNQTEVGLLRPPKIEHATRSQQKRTELRMEKCASAPLLEDDVPRLSTAESSGSKQRKRNAISQFLKSVGGHHRPHKELERCRSERVKKLKRYPSLETLDHAPSSNHKAKKKIKNTKVQTTQENQQQTSGQRNSSLNCPKQRADSNGRRRKLTRSVSDPCINFKAVEEKLLIRKATKRAARKTRRRAGTMIRRVKSGAGISETTADNRSRLSHIDGTKQAADTQRVALSENPPGIRIELGGEELPQGLITHELPTWELRSLPKDGAQTNHSPPEGATVPSPKNDVRSPPVGFDHSMSYPGEVALPESSWRRKRRTQSESGYFGFLRRQRPLEGIHEGDWCTDFVVEKETVV